MFNQAALETMILACGKKKSITQYLGKSYKT